MADRNPKRRRAGLAALYCALCFCLSGALIAALQPRPAAAVDTEAQQFILMDAGTGMVLAEKNADEPMYPASMSKIMTLYVVFEHLADGQLDLEDTFTVSKKAWRMKGSRMFLEVNTKVTVSELLRGVIVQSGNDACIVLAEGLAGSEAGFADLMNETAVELGLADSHFSNATGWPDSDHITTARDVAELSRRIIADFPEYYPMFAEKTFTYNGIKQGNRNPLLYRYDGADGLKTGYTEASGHGLAASAKRGEQRLVLVVNGINGVDTRARESERLLSYGFRAFRTYVLFRAGQVVDNFEVWLGEAEELPLVAESDIVLMMPRKSRKAMVVKIVADGPIAAPVEKGTRVATLVVSAPDVETREWPLLAGATVDSLSGFGRIGAAIDALIWGRGG
ncbi:MAG: D-alanyl-D-alanine carboxypeptidase [Rhodospirillaceae bacterium]|nr:D-alanyl-D-alanine carboxypeptidase [Rhodospirillaceae bacterium]